MNKLAVVKSTKAAKTTSTSKAFQVLDSFAGAGGFSLGFQMAGGTIAGAIEIDRFASETFKANHPESTVFTGDLGSLSAKRIECLFSKQSPDVILGGPPCQGYSICNKNAGDPKDPKNSLFREFLRLGEIFSPRLMIMENVPNLQRAMTESKIPVLEIIRSELSRLGYHVYDKVLQASHYGVPQIRRRLFVIASKQALEHPFPEPTHTDQAEDGENWFSNKLKSCPTLWDAISDLPSLEACEGTEVQPYTEKAKNDYQRLMRAGSTEVYNHAAMNHTPRMVERFSVMNWGDSSSDVPEHLRPYARSSGGVISKKSYDQNNRRMHPDRPCHTIAASFYANFVHPFKHRNFTAREGARIQSFPDWFRFSGKPTLVSTKLLEREGRADEIGLCQYNQIGNAVPPLLAAAVANHLIKLQVI